MTYYLSLGANIGAREQTLYEATHMIEQQIGPVRRCSSLYYSAPWGYESEHAFCNLCCSVESGKTPIEVLHLTQDIERTLGRDHKSHIINHKPVYCDRTIDIDIIRIFDATGKEYCIDSPELTIPHPLWQEREFVKVPLAEIMP